jgi:beta-N-acetylhexosaminidase
VPLGNVPPVQGLRTGRYLRGVGINLDFAPVSDVPTTADNFLGARAFAGTATLVASAASGFAAGLARAGVAASAKHFPGLGAAGPLDTDFTRVTITASRSSLRNAYLPYRAMARLGSTVAPLVMVSDARYPTLDRSGLPAVFSRPILQRELSIAGMRSRVAITDDLEVPSVSGFASTPVKAALAGDDILMFAQHEARSEQAYSELLHAVARGALPAATVRSAAAKVLEAKQQLLHEGS